jgi:hypothetical protein
MLERKRTFEGQNSVSAREVSLPSRSAVRLWLSLGATFLALACATPPSAVAPRPPEESKPVVEFPSPARLSAIVAQPIPQSGVLKREARSRDWTVDGAQTASSYGESWQPVSPWDNAFAADLSKSGRDVRLTRAMNCAAQEFGRFYLETQDLPPEDMKRFIVGACGGISAQLGILSLQGEVSPKTTDSVLLGRWKGQISPDLILHLPADASEAGFWFGRRGKQAVAMLAYGVLHADVLPFSLVPDANGEITVEGETREAAEYFGGYANHGAVGVEHCLVDPSLHRPRFRFVCRVDSADESAWIDLLYATPGRVVAKPFARVLARRRSGQSIPFHAAVAAKPGRIEREEDFAPAVLVELNRIRLQAGLPPARLAEAESKTAAQLAKAYIASEANGNREEADTIALGMIAGWQVDDGMIRDGSFVASSVPGSNDAGLWLSIALSMPLARESLLGRTVEEVSFGPTLIADPPGLGAIMAGYQFYHGNDHALDVKRLFARVLAARQRLSLPPPRRLIDVQQAMLDQLARVYEGKQQPMEALQSVLRMGTRAYGENMKGYAVELISLDELEIPESVLKLKNLDLEIGVTHHKPKGAAWGQLVVLVAFLDRKDDAQ